LLMLIVSCSGVPKTDNKEQAPTELAITVNSEQAPADAAITANVEQLTTSNEPLTVSNEQAPTGSTIVEISQPEPVPEESVLADADTEEKHMVEYAEYIETLSSPDNLDPSEIAHEPELLTKNEPNTIIMETLRPLDSSSPVELAPKPSPVLPDQRTAQVVPHIREALPPSSPRETLVLPPKKNEAPVIARESPPKADVQPEPAPTEEKILQPDYPITFSRTARATVGQLIEIPFRGKDWVFLGEVGARRGIAYDSRKLDTEGESFIFRVEASGVYALKFYRQDFAHDFILNDHVQIIAGAAPQTTGLAWFNPPIDQDRVIAGPRWPNFIEQPLMEAVQPSTPVAAQPPVVVQPPVEVVRPAQPSLRQPSAARNEAPRPQGPSGNAVAQAGPLQPQNPQPSQQPDPPYTPEPISPDAILKQARDEFNAGRFASAITMLDEFCKSFPSGSDEAWWLYGQCYEANSPNRNMLAALDYYRRLVREYPQSSRLSDARRRIAYLERYYINIQ
jgi:hypothetical protein